MLYSVILLDIFLDLLLVYTLFAFFEYMAVFSNIFFNYSVIDDIKGARLKICAPTIKEKLH